VTALVSALRSAYPNFAFKLIQSGGELPSTPTTSQSALPEPTVDTPTPYSTDGAVDSEVPPETLPTEATEVLTSRLFWQIELSHLETTESDADIPQSVFLNEDLFDSMEYQRLLELYPVVSAFWPEMANLNQHEATTLKLTIQNKEDMLLHSSVELRQFVEERGKKGITLQRFKGLGEMMPEQLWATTMNPETRTLLRVEIEEAAVADKLFDILMGERVEPRRKFIESNAALVAHLDI
jgi:DNA gyrase subunit B